MGFLVLFLFGPFWSQLFCLWCEKNWESMLFVQRFQSTKNTEYSQNSQRHLHIEPVTTYQYGFMFCFLLFRSFTNIHTTLSLCNCNNIKILIRIVHCLLLTLHLKNEQTKQLYSAVLFVGNILCVYVQCNDAVSWRQNFWYKHNDKVCLLVFICSFFHNRLQMCLRW